jgi:hypothetical protein
MKFELNILKLTIQFCIYENVLSEHFVAKQYSNKIMTAFFLHTRNYCKLKYFLDKEPFLIYKQ